MGDKAVIADLFLSGGGTDTTARSSTWHLFVVLLPRGSAVKCNVKSQPRVSVGWAALSLDYCLSNDGKQLVHGNFKVSKKKVDIEGTEITERFSGKLKDKSVTTLGSKMPPLLSLEILSPWSP